MKRGRWISLCAAGCRFYTVGRQFLLFVLQLRKEKVLVNTIVRTALVALCLAILCVSSSAFAQDSVQPAPAHGQSPALAQGLPGFEGLAWGDPVEKARSIFGKKFTSDAQLSNSTNLVYTSGLLGGREISALILFFGSDGFAKAAVFFQTKESRVIDDYNDLKATMSEKYGKPSHDFRIFRSPYEDGDGYETQAIQLGKAIISSFWTFPVPEKEDNSLGLLITDDLHIQINYENGARWGQMLKQRKEMNAKDF